MLKVYPSAHFLRILKPRNIPLPFVVLLIFFCSFGCDSSTQTGSFDSFSILGFSPDCWRKNVGSIFINTDGITVEDTMGVIEDSVITVFVGEEKCPLVESWGQNMLKAQLPSSHKTGYIKIVYRGKEVLSKAPFLACQDSSFYQPGDLTAISINLEGIIATIHKSYYFKGIGDSVATRSSFDTDAVIGFSFVASSFDKDSLEQFNTFHITPRDSFVIEIGIFGVFFASRASVSFQLDTIRNCLLNVEVIRRFADKTLGSWCDNYFNGDQIVINQLPILYKDNDSLYAMISLGDGLAPINYFAYSRSDNWCSKSYESHRDESLVALKGATSTASFRLGLKFKK